MVHITGTLLKNYGHCKRQAYLYYYGLNFINEEIKKGEVLHQINNSEELIFDNIKIDSIKNDKVIEFKKTSSNLYGTKLQILYYLKILRNKGIKLKGVIIDLTNNKRYTINLDKKNEKKLNNAINDLNMILNKTIPERLERKFCRGCSFYDYCWVD